ncbi:MAG TPA: hypothetical protein V6D11_31840 [Waterburya sp.]
MRLTKLIGALVLAAASSGLPLAVSAQTNPSTPSEALSSPRIPDVNASFTTPPNRLETIPEAFERAFFQESGTFYRNRSIPRQISYIIGPGLPWGAGFPELELERDARRINSLYNEVLELQASSDPIIRTPDLPNPFGSSLRTQYGPRRFGTQLEGGEFNFETLPPR